LDNKAIHDAVAAAYDEETARATVREFNRVREHSVRGLEVKVRDLQKRLSMACSHYRRASTISAK
jgi:hypothetical protein